MAKDLFLALTMYPEQIKKENLENQYENLQIWLQKNNYTMKSTGPMGEMGSEEQ